MISYIRGTLAELSEDMIVVENAGIGYSIFVPLAVIESLPRIGSEVMIYTHFQVREDGMSLYGFLSRPDLSMFRQLIGVNGIGPKGALGILSVLRPDDLRMAILADDAKAIAKAPGVGVKTAQRVILDLKDKVRPEEMLAAVGYTVLPEAGAAAGSSGAAREAIEALTALGYSATEAARAVHKAEPGDDMTAEAILKASLKYLAF